MTVRLSRAIPGHLDGLFFVPPAASFPAPNCNPAMTSRRSSGGTRPEKFCRASLVHVLPYGGSILLSGPGERGVSRASGPGRSRWVDGQRRHPRRRPLREGSAGSGPACPPALTRGVTRAVRRRPPGLPGNAAADRLTPAATRARASIRPVAMAGAAQAASRGASSDSLTLDCFEMRGRSMSEGVPRSGGVPLGLFWTPSCVKERAMNRPWLEEQIRVQFGSQRAALVAALHEVQVCVEFPDVLHRRPADVPR